MIMGHFLNAAPTAGVADRRSAGFDGPILREVEGLSPNGGMNFVSYGLRSLQYPNTRAPGSGARPQKSGGLH